MPIKTGTPVRLVRVAMLWLVIAAPPALGAEPQVREYSELGFSISLPTSWLEVRRPTVHSVRFRSPQGVGLTISRYPQPAPLNALKQGLRRRARDNGWVIVREERLLIAGLPAYAALLEVPARGRRKIVTRQLVLLVAGAERPHRLHFSALKASFREGPLRRIAMTFAPTAKKR